MPKKYLTLLKYFMDQSIFCKLFEWEMLIRNPLTTLFQMSFALTKLFLIVSWGICCGLVDTMPRVPKHVWVCRFESTLAPQAGWRGRYIHVWYCGGLSMAPLQLKDPLELFVKRMEFLPGYKFLFWRDMTWAVVSNIKPHSFLPSFLHLILS